MSAIIGIKCEMPYQIITQSDKESAQSNYINLAPLRNTYWRNKTAQWQCTL